MGKLDGRVALITGGSRGIGYAIAETLVGEGARVMLTARTPDTLAGAGERLGEVAATFVGDVADHDSAEACIQETLERFGRLDMLVNNAALDTQSGPTVSMPVTEFARIFEVNVYAPLFWTQLAWQAAMRDHGGVVLNVASLGAFALYPNMGAYNSSKAALVHLTRALAAELGPRVRVNALAPGLIKTEMSEREWARIEERFARRLPLERLGESEDCARAALFLLCDDSSWITGETLVVDGGTIVQWGKAHRKKPKEEEPDG
jgi:NAD(P)-dependent dehydrogenase (short-subunit alcohol dehydrogenase family)